MEVAAPPAADGATATAAPAGAALAASSFPDVTVGIADGATAAVIPSNKRRRSGGPARATRREAAFLASKAYDATDNRQPMNLGYCLFL